MKILFLQTKTLWVDLVGVMYLSTALKRGGHQAALRFVSTPGETAQALEDEKPDVAAFSAVTGNHVWAIKTAAAVKALNPEITTLMGGPHPTFFPEAALEKSIDFVIRGEAEEAVVRFMDALPIQDPGQVPNLAWADNGRLETSDLLPLVQDLDSLGIPDRDFYPRHYQFFSWNPLKSFFASRGCPFHCTYCFNHLFHELYAGKGRMLRFRGHEHVIEEILYTKSKYHLPIVYFEDDTFNIDKKWMFEFMEKYRSEVGIPFECNVRIDLMDRETAQALARGGCILANFGLESGSEKLRMETLGKKITDEQIIHGAACLKEAGILIQTTNMLGLPGETVADGFKTVELNQKAGVDIPMVCIFQPFPRLKLTQKALELGVFDPNDTDKIGSSIEKSVLKSPDIQVLVNIQKFAYIANRFPFITPLVKRLVYLPGNPVFRLIQKIAHVHGTYRQMKMSPLKFLRYIWFHRQHQS